MGFAGSSGSGFLVLARAVGSSEDLSEGGITPKFTLVLGRSVPHKLFDRGNQFHAGYWHKAFCSSLLHWGNRVGEGGLLSLPGSR